MLNLSMIAPTSLVEVANKYSGFMMTLAHLYDDPIYKQKVLDYVKQGGVVYLDNSYFELGRAIELSKLLDIGREVNASVIVLPDDSFEGVDKVISSGFTPMLVPASFNSAKLAFETLRDYGLGSMRVGISNIHVKKHFGVTSLKGKGRHIFIIQVLEAVYGLDLDHILSVCEGGGIHFLGLDDDPWDEIQLLSSFYNASLDSSAFVWPFLREGNSGSIMRYYSKYREPVDFNFTPEEESSVAVLKDYLTFLTQVFRSRNIITTPELCN